MQRDVAQVSTTSITACSAACIKPVRSKAIAGDSNGVFWQTSANGDIAFRWHRYRGDGTLGVFGVLGAGASVVFAHLCACVSEFSLPRAPAPWRGGRCRCHSSSFLRSSASAGSGRDRCRGCNGVDCMALAAPRRFPHFTSGAMG